MLGRLNADYFLGGQISLDLERARYEVERQIAKPLRLGVEQAAAGIVELFETSLRNEAVGRILGKGYSPADYSLLCYGGGGPLHVAGYTAGIPYQQVLIPEWAAGFSAFGCACADFEYRFDQQVDLPLMPDHPDEVKLQMGQLLVGAWGNLRERIGREFAKSGYETAEIDFRVGVRMQYYGQLIDIEVEAPSDTIETIADIDELIAAFERTYARLYARAASSPELGYLVAQAIVKGSVPVEKPALPVLARAETPPEPKFERHVWWRGGFEPTPVYEMGDVGHGHTIEGPAILEAESTTFALPPDRRTWLDQNRIFHLESKEG